MSAVDTPTEKRSAASDDGGEAVTGVIEDGCAVTKTRTRTTNRLLLSGVCCVGRGRVGRTDSISSVDVTSGTDTTLENETVTEDVVPAVVTVGETDSGVWGAGQKAPVPLADLKENCGKRRVGISRIGRKGMRLFVTTTTVFRRRCVADRRPTPTLRNGTTRRAGTVAATCVFVLAVLRVRMTTAVVVSTNGVTRIENLKPVSTEGVLAGRAVSRCPTDVLGTGNDCRPFRLRCLTLCIKIYLSTIKYLNPITIII